MIDDVEKWNDLEELKKANPNMAFRFAGVLQRGNRRCGNEPFKAGGIPLQILQYQAEFFRRLA